MKAKEDEDEDDELTEGERMRQEVISELKDKIIQEEDEEDVDNDESNDASASNDNETLTAL